MGKPCMVCHHPYLVMTLHVSAGECGESEGQVGEFYGGKTSHSAFGKLY